MTHALISLRGLVLIAAATTLTACDKNPADKSDINLVTAKEIPLDATDNAISSGNALSAVVGASEIPYPMYPNGQSTA